MATTKPCRPHDWRPPHESDRHLDCRSCGRVMDFQTELTPGARSSILNALRRRREPAEVATFVRCFAIYELTSAGMLDPDRWNAPIEPLTAEDLKPLTVEDIQAEAVRFAAGERTPSRRERMAREQGGAV